MLRIVGLGAEGRHQHRRATLDRRAGRLPDPFAGKRVREDRLDPRRPGEPPSSAPSRPRPSAAGCFSCGPPFCRRVPGVVDVLDLVDQPGCRRAHRLSPTRRCARKKGDARRPQHPVSRTSRSPGTTARGGRRTTRIRRRRRLRLAAASRRCSRCAARRASRAEPEGESAASGGLSHDRTGTRPPQTGHGRTVGSDRPRNAKAEIRTALDPRATALLFSRRASPTAASEATQERIGAILG